MTEGITTITNSQIQILLHMVPLVHNERSIHCTALAYHAKRVAGTEPIATECYARSMANKAKRVTGTTIYRITVLRIVSGQPAKRVAGTEPI